MPNLSNAQVSQLNNDDTNMRQVGLGTVLEKIIAGGFMNIEPIAGKTNTGYSVIDNCDTLHMSTLSGNTIWNAVADTGMFNNGIASTWLQSLSTSTTLGQTAMATITQTSWAGIDTIGFWAFTDRPLAAGNVQIVLNDTIGGVQTINLPAINPSTFMQWIEIPLGAVARTEIVGYGFKRNVAMAFNLHIDQITGFLAANTSVLGNIPLQTEFTNYSLQTNSPKIVMFPTAAASANTPVVLAENTDYFVGTNTKRIIFMTNQSANTGFVVYMA